MPLAQRILPRLFRAPQGRVVNPTTCILNVRPGALIVGLSGFASGLRALGGGDGVWVALSIAERRPSLGSASRLCLTLGFPSQLVGI